MGFCPFKIECLCFENIKHHVPVLKLDLKRKIELKVNLDFSNVKFYAYFSN